MEGKPKGNKSRRHSLLTQVPIPTPRDVEFVGCEDTEQNVRSSQSVTSLWDALSKWVLDMEQEPPSFTEPVYTEAILEMIKSKTRSPI